MADQPELPAAFWEIHADLPRQGAGSDAATEQALAMCTELPARPRILDVGCGPGRQSVVLARVSGGHVTAVDRHQPFLEQLRETAMAEGLSDRITGVQADMRALPFEPSSFDLVWSEGAAFVMGVAAALASWRRLLRPAGYLAYSEIVWTGEERPAAVVDFLAGYPAMTDVEGNTALIAAAAYDLVGHFPVPHSAWWDEYYTPLEARLPALRERYRAEADSLAVIESTAQEIDLRRHYRTSYDYQFFVTLKPGPA
jgi:ubiquinone/menaquinone biosynthesis C-methylase UbiE